MRDSTKLAHLGRRSRENAGVVNPAVQHASTILHPNVASFLANKPTPLRYGRYGVGVTKELEAMAAALENADDAIALGSGMTAVASTFLALCRAGDHVLVPDSVYAPTRDFCDETLTRFGIETTYYDPRIGAGIAASMRPSTRLVMCESPGSWTFEIQDCPAILRAAKAHRGANGDAPFTMIDNTWGTQLYFKAIDHGFDFSVHAATKYPVGHADVLMGLIAGKQPRIDELRRQIFLQGGCAPAPDDCYLALRGFRTMAVRLERHFESALAVARWLEARPEVLAVMHPGLESDPGHALWKRDFLGACGLFGFVLAPMSRAQLEAMMDGLQLFGMGYSWGGYESLLIPTFPEKKRSATRWAPGGQTMRIHIGLEAVEDLIADLDAGLARAAAAAPDRARSEP